MRNKLQKIIFLLFPLLCFGCVSTQSAIAPASERIVCFVPGAGGDVGYGGLKSGLQESGVTDLRVFHWGSAIFVLNLQSTSIHEEAEKELAALISDWLGQRPDCQIDLIAHSAGNGVVLGALGRLGEGLRVHNVVLLAPSVSPGYDLVPALRRITGRLNHFYSSEDIFFLKWRTGTFGSYDNIRTPAAGHLGFSPNPALPADLAGKLVQHAYDPAWRELGNDGSHVGPIAHDFIRTVVAPLINAK